MRRDVLVLCYHAVSERWDADLSITPRALEHQLAGLVRRGYRGTTFLDAVTDPPHRRTLAVTFDDAYRSVLELGLPVLSKLGLPGSVYVPTDFAGSGEPMAWPGIDRWLETHAAELVPLGWDELRRLADAGWEVGSHTCSHPMLTQLGDEALAAELADSRAAVEGALGRACPTLAYPYGNCDSRVVEAARRAGYRAAGAISSPRAPAALDWPRVGIWSYDAAWRFRVKASALVRRVRQRGEPFDT